MSAPSVVSGVDLDEVSGVDRRREWRLATVLKATRTRYDMKLNQEEGIIKYGIAWMLGVPVSVLVLIFLVSRAC